jgi:predicted ester cyclase
MSEGNKTLILRGFEEGITLGDNAVSDELLAPDYVNHSLPTPAPGSDGFKKVIGVFRAAFPDLHVSVEDVIAEGDRVATRGTMRGALLEPGGTVVPAPRAKEVMRIASPLVQG